MRQTSESRRYSAKPGSDARQLRYHQSSPKSVAVLLGLSFERESDRVRIESYLQCDPTSIVMSVSLHPQPSEAEMEVLGPIKKFWPVRLLICSYKQ
jgi:hypothetical protein